MKIRWLLCMIVSDNLSLTSDTQGNTINTVYSFQDIFIYSKNQFKNVEVMSCSFYLYDPNLAVCSLLHLNTFLKTLFLNPNIVHILPFIYTNKTVKWES